MASGPATIRSIAWRSQRSLSETMGLRDEAGVAAQERELAGRQVEHHEPRHSPQPVPLLLAGRLRLDAQLAPEGAVVDATSAFGTIRIVVPAGWQVTVEGTPVGGTIENKRPGGAVETASGPSLRARATAVLGEVKVTRQ
jgi:hypothetical protein